MKRSLQGLQLYCLLAVMTLWGALRVNAQCPSAYFEVVSGSGSDGKIESTFGCSVCSTTDACPTNYLKYTSGIHNGEFSFSTSWGYEYEWTIADGGTTTIVNPELQSDCSSVMPTNCSKPYPCSITIYNPGTASHVWNCPLGDEFVSSWTKNTSTGIWYNDDTGVPESPSFNPDATLYWVYYWEDQSDTTTGECPNTTRTIDSSYSDPENSLSGNAEKVIVIDDSCPHKKTTTTWSGSDSEDGDVSSWNATDTTEEKFETPYQATDMEGRAHGAAQVDLPVGTTSPPWGPKMAESTRGLTSSCASETQAKYRVAICGTDPKKRYKISWKQITFRKDGTNAVTDPATIVGPYHVQGQPGILYYPSIEGKEVPLPPWPKDICEGGLYKTTYVGPIKVEEEQ